MPNRQLFAAAAPGLTVPSADAVNEAGGRAYALPAEDALTQYVMTGTFNGTFYATAEDQLNKVMGLLKDPTVRPEFVARLAVHARQSGYMKDTPALLLAWLCSKGPGGVQLASRVFNRVVDTQKMLRNFCQIVRSGVTGRKSFGSGPKRLVQDWLAAQSTTQLFKGSVGQSPSLADVIKMVHPAGDTERSAFYRYMIGKSNDDGLKLLPEVARQYEDFKAGRSTVVPELPFMMLDSLPLLQADWKFIAGSASWQTLRMNLNNFARKGVFTDTALVATLADRLCDPEAISRSRVFPYQLLIAFLNCSDQVPAVLKLALQDAMELSIDNVPEFTGLSVVVCPDVSGSMSSAATGTRAGATSKVRCIDVAGLMAAAVLRRNPTAQVIPFEGRVKPINLNPRDSVMTNAAKLAAIGGGSTDCSAPLKALNASRTPVDVVIFISDNQSWVNDQMGLSYRTSRTTVATPYAAEWAALKRNNPKARLVCIDIQPCATVQAVSSKDVLNIGGFADSVFTVVDDFVTGRTLNLTAQIEAIAL